MKPNEYTDDKGNLIQILGMIGLKFSDAQEKYFVGSEILVGSDHGIAIFQDDIRYFDKNDNRILSETKRKEIIGAVLGILNSNNIKPLLL